MHIFHRGRDHFPVIPAEAAGPVRVQAVIRKGLSLLRHQHRQPVQYPVPQENRKDVVLRIHGNMVARKTADSEGPPSHIAGDFRIVLIRMADVTLNPQELCPCAVCALPSGSVDCHFPQGFLPDDFPFQHCPAEPHHISPGGKQSCMSAEISRIALQHRGLGIMRNPWFPSFPEDLLPVFDPMFPVITLAVLPAFRRNRRPGFCHTCRFQDQLPRTVHKAHPGSRFQHIFQDHGRNIGIDPSHILVRRGG